MITIKKVKTHEAVFIQLGANGGNNLGKDFSPGRVPGLKLRFAGEVPELGLQNGIIASIGSDYVFIPEPNIVAVQFSHGTEAFATVPAHTPPAMPKHPKESKAGKVQ